MKKLFILLMATGMSGVASAQSTVVGNSSGAYPAKSSCQAEVNAINHKYNKQVTAHKTNKSLSAVDREYKILMTQLYRNEKLAQAEQSCGATTMRYRSCIDAANAINQSYEQQKETYRNNARYTTAQQSAKIEDVNRARNGKLRDLLASCKY